MKDQSLVAIIGGGVVGASVLFYLNRLGCIDTNMLDRAELTSRSMRHVAGGMPRINRLANVAEVPQSTIELQKEIEDLSRQNVGVST